MLFKSPSTDPSVRATATQTGAVAILIVVVPGAVWQIPPLPV